MSTASSVLPNGAHQAHCQPPDERRLNALPILMIAVYNLISQDATRLEHDEEHINNLADDFRRRLKDKPGEHPVQTPLRVVRRGDKFLIVAGNHRYWASLRIPLHELPCSLLPDDLDEAEFIIEAASDNELHHGYKPIERARNILRVAELRNCSHAHAGKLLGIGAPDVTKLLRVLKSYPQDLWPLIGEGDGKVPFTTAYTLARLHPNEAKIRELTDRVVKGLLTRDAAEEEVTRFLSGGKKPKDRPLIIKYEGFELKAKKPTPESIRAFLDKLATALKRLKGPDDIHDLPFHFKTV
jgi:ParB-like chromosome segregation protein Spo0J